MASTYLPIWTGIKKLKKSEELQVRVHESSVGRIIQAVRKQKTIECAVKKKVGMKHPGALIVRKEHEVNAAGKQTDFINLYFSLQFNWDWI